MPSARVPRSWEGLLMSISSSQWEGYAGEIKLLQSLCLWWCNDVIFLNCSRLQLRKFRMFLALPFSGVFRYRCALVLWDLLQARHVLPPHLHSVRFSLFLWGFCIVQQLLFHTARPGILTPMLLAGLSAESHDPLRTETGFLFH